MLDDNRAMDRLTKSKEAALLEAERTVQMALTKAALVDDLQNKNQELMKQIEICQVFIICEISPFAKIHVNDSAPATNYYIKSRNLRYYLFLLMQEENKIMDKMHRQKVAEVDKLTQTVRELEEAVLAGGAAANAVRDYQRKVQEMNVRGTRLLFLELFLILLVAIPDLQLNYESGSFHSFVGGEKNSGQRTSSCKD